MSHQVESMFYVGETPWHRLGRDLTADPPKTAEAAIKAAGLDWKVDLRPVYTKSSALVAADAAGNPGAVTGSARGIKCPGQFAVVRSSDDRYLGMVGSRYVPLQNSEAFGFLDPILKSGEAVFETAGSLRGGAVIWALLRTQEPFEVIPGDKVSTYMLVSNSHDGSKTVQVRATATRVVCANTLAVALPSRESKARREAEGAASIRHTASVHDRTREAVRALEVAYTAHKEGAEICRNLASIHMPRKTVQEFVASLFEVDGTLSSRAENKVEQVMDLYDNGRGSAIRGVKGTAWGAYNAVTDFASHILGTTQEQQRLGKVDRDTAESRMESILNGTGKELIDRSLKKLLAVV